MLRPAEHFPLGSLRIILLKNRESYDIVILAVDAALRGSAIRKIHTIRREYMKRLTCLLIALTMILTTTACGSKQPTAVKDTGSSAAASVEASTTLEPVKEEEVSAAQPEQAEAADAQCVLVSSSAIMQKDSLDDPEFLYLAEVENTGSCAVSFDYDCSLDLCAEDGTILYTIDTVDISPNALEPGDHAFLSVTEYESFTSGVTFADVASVSLNAYYAPCDEQIEKPAISFENITVTDNGGPQVSATMTNDSDENYSDAYVLIPVYDKSGKLVSTDWTTVTLTAHESKGFTQTLYYYPNDLDFDGLTAAPVAFQPIYSFSDEQMTSLKETTPITAVEDVAQPEDPSDDEDSTLSIDADGTITIEDAVNILDSSMAENFDENYELYLDGSMLIINIWEDGAALEASLAQGGDQDMLDDWDTLTEALISLCETGDSVLSLADEPGYTTLVSLLNDINLENTLLSVYDGTVVYDYVNGIDIYS